MEKKSGFTFIELVIVIALLAILSTYAVTRWPSANVNLNAEAQQLASEIRYTQSLAFSKGQRYRLNLTSTNYSITDISGNAVSDPNTGNNSTTFSNGISTSLSNLPNNIIAFDGNGSPYIDSTATTTLTANATITLSKGSVSRIVLITPETGRVILQ
jgi:MSHA pilin protein MshC